MNPGKLISFEGIDGCGKSTAIKLVSEMLNRAGIQHIISRQPGGTSVGDAIRHLLLFDSKNLCPISELLLFCASFAQSAQETILPNLKKGIWVISDRYTDSTRAYQGAGRNIPREQIHAILQAGVETLPELIPAKTFLLDISPETADLRTNNRGPKDKIEQEGLQFQALVRAEYLRLAQKYPQRFLTISTETRNPSEVSDILSHEIQKLLL